jgi:hypothetical protein
MLCEYEKMRVHIGLSCGLLVDGKHGNNDMSDEISGVLAHWWPCLAWLFDQRRRHWPPPIMVGQHHNVRAGDVRFPDQSRTRDV